MSIQNKAYLKRQKLNYLDQQKNKSNFFGTLLKFDKEKIYIKVDTEEREIERKDIAQIKLKYSW